MDMSCTDTGSIMPRTASSTQISEHMYVLTGHRVYLVDRACEQPDAAYHMIFPTDPAIWVTHWAPRGALKKTILSDFTTPLPSYRTEEDKKHFIDLLTKNGFEGPTRWYAVMTSNKSAEDDMRSKSS